MKPARTGRGRLGMVGYASILRFVQRCPATTAQVCEANVGWLNTTRFVMRKMHAARLVHISGWEPTGKRGVPFTAVWSFGAGVDAPFPPPGRPRASERANNVAPEMVAFAALIRALEQPHTKAELTEISGLNEETIRKVLDHGKRIGLVRVAGWQPTEGDGYPAALWKLGRGRNIPRPEPIPRAEVHRAYREKRRAAIVGAQLQATFHGMAALEAA